MIHPFLQTIKYLKFKQVFYRLYYLLNRLGKKSLITFSEKPSYVLTLQDSLYSHVSYSENNTFTFLNESHPFGKNIDWNYPGKGMLWTYNLNYFEFLHQSNLDKESGLCLINDYITQYHSIKAGYDSYPLSLRNLFWIRFLSKHAIKDKRIDSFLYDTCQILSKHLEFHLLGNHLMENAFSLLFGAYYFHDEKLYRKAYKLLKSELEEQILSDGAHFELSPMYHQILLYRLLDCVNLLSNNFWKKDDLLVFLSEKASKMLSWQANMTFPSGNIPHLNDASSGIAPTSNQLVEYAGRLNIRADKLPLSSSRYRVFKECNLLCIMDIGGIEPGYQPGHAHADTFNFVLEVNNQAIFVDTGCSTYEQGNIRMFERGTPAHNTVTVNGLNSSQVWASHRTGKRAKVKIIEDKPDTVKAQHDGYSSIGKIHERTFIRDKHSIRIIDEVKGTGAVSKNTAYFHLDSRVKNINIIDNYVNISDVNILFEGYYNIYTKEYEQALAFNQRVNAKCICVEFSNHLETKILFN
jgi:hypothetical protein